MLSKGPSGKIGKGIADPGGYYHQQHLCKAMLPVPQKIKKRDHERNIQKAEEAPDDKGIVIFGKVSDKAYHVQNTGKHYSIYGILHLSSILVIG